VTALGLASSALAAEPEDLGARPSVPPARTAFDQDGPPIGRSDSLVQRNQLRILDPGPSLMDPPRSRESWQSLVERDLDRVMGRIEPETLHQLRRLEQDRAAREGIDSQRESERFLEERDRSLRLEQRDREQTHSIQRRRVVERESDRLRAERERFQRALSGGNPGAVAADTRRLEQLRAAHEAALTTIESERAKALSTTDADTTLTPQQRTDNRAAANARFDRLRDQRTSEYESARSRITGFAGEKGD
jgi:hypothetical protein